MTKTILNNDEKSSAQLFFNSSWGRYPDGKCALCDNIAVYTSLKWNALEKKGTKQNMCQKCVNTSPKKKIFAMQGLENCKKFVEEKMGCSLTDEEYLAILEAQKANLS